MNSLSSSSNTRSSTVTLTQRVSGSQSEGPTQTVVEQSTNRSLDTAAVAGVTIAVIIAVVLMLGALYVLLRRRARKFSCYPINESEMSSADNGGTRSARGGITPYLFAQILPRSASPGKRRRERPVWHKLYDISHHGQDLGGGVLVITTSSRNALPPTVQTGVDNTESSPPSAGEEGHTKDPIASQLENDPQDRPMPLAREGPQPEDRRTPDASEWQSMAETLPGYEQARSDPPPPLHR